MNFSCVAGELLISSCLGVLQQPPPARYWCALNSLTASDWVQPLAPGCFLISEGRVYDEYKASFVLG